MIKQLLPLVVAATVVCADDYNHRYKEGDRVDLWVNKVSPEPMLLNANLACRQGRGEFWRSEPEGGGCDRGAFGAEERRGS